MGLRENVANSLRVQRAIKKMHQRELAEKLGVSTQTISNIESQVRFPSPEFLDQVAEVLGIDVSDLTKDKY